MVVLTACYVFHLSSISGLIPGGFTFWLESCWASKPQLIL